MFSRTDSVKSTRQVHPAVEEVRVRVAAAASRFDGALHISKGMMYTSGA